MSFLLIFGAVYRQELIELVSWWYGAVRCNNRLFARSVAHEWGGGQDRPFLHYCRTYGG